MHRRHRGGGRAIWKLLNIKIFFNGICTKMASVRIIKIDFLQRQNAVYVEVSPVQRRAAVKEDDNQPHHDTDEIQKWHCQKKINKVTRKSAPSFVAFKTKTRQNRKGAKPKKKRGKKKRMKDVFLYYFSNPLGNLQKTSQ